MVLLHVQKRLCVIKAQHCGSECTAVSIKNKHSRQWSLLWAVVHTLRAYNQGCLETLWCNMIKHTHTQKKPWSHYTFDFSIDCQPVFQKPFLLLLLLNFSWPCIPPYNYVWGWKPQFKKPQSLTLCILLSQFHLRCGRHPEHRMDWKLIGFKHSSVKKNHTTDFIEVESQRCKLYSISHCWQSFNGKTQINEKTEIIWPMRL